MNRALITPEVRRLAHGRREAIATHESTRPIFKLHENHGQVITKSVILGHRNTLRLANHTLDPGAVEPGQEIDGVRPRIRNRRATRNPRVETKVREGHVILIIVPVLMKRRAGHFELPDHSIFD